MDNQRRCSKSFSCESLFNERQSLKRKFKVMETPNSSFNNEDYKYLMTNKEIITTCQEALMENAKSTISNYSDVMLLTPSRVLRPDNKVNTIEPDQKSSFKEFSKWLNRTEEQLDAVCYCAILNQVASITSLAQRQLTDAISEHKAVQSEIQNVGTRFINSIKLNGNAVSNTLLAVEERRWHSLWLKSLEYLMILEDFNKCPTHYTKRESSSKRYKLGAANVNSFGKENNSMMKNRRIQTTMVGTSFGDSINMEDGKYEIIHKDIGYSSDADMSDSCEAHSCSNLINSIAKNSRKRHRRRRSQFGQRPWSFHSDWAGWDYYQPPLCSNSEYRSSEDLNSYEDENLVRSLTEFGENYEKWFKPDEFVLRASTPTPEINEADLETTNLDDKIAQKLHINEQEEAQLKEELSDHDSTTNSVSFIIYAAVTMLLAILLSSLFDHFSPSSFHVHKTYLKRSPPI